MDKHPYYSLIITADILLQILVALLILQLFLLQFSDMKKHVVALFLEKMLYPFLWPFRKITAVFSFRKEVSIVLLLGLVIFLEKFLPRYFLSLAP